MTTGRRPPDLDTDTDTDTATDTATATDTDTAWKPVLSRSVMFRHDRVRDTDLLVMPERVVVLQGNAGSVLRLCDGANDVGAIVATLAAQHPGAPIADEVPLFLSRLRAEGWLK
ncbi:pyrroloquinoline quinone biosynthesis peptide chaperone PqqD [Streptomyces sp. NBC_01506]|uniref:pyrroloquinoline quinone biosynthesis peptide chaperone PqqD n=1 Tax=Streptomyces sp. NBC_01506 TaxID=2903887 RepID=UPI003868ADD0